MSYVSPCITTECLPTSPNLRPTSYRGIGLDYYTVLPAHFQDVVVANVGVELYLVQSRLNLAPTILIFT